MIYGAITNSWREQLESEELLALVGQAQARGARHIEFRQTCLGSCESGEGDDWRPSLDGLAAIVDAYPGLTFDLAMAWPCLTRQSDPHGEAWQAALAGAQLVGGSSPQLRIVDPSSFDAPWQSPSDIPDTAWGLASLASEAARQGVILSMENSGQPIGSMAMLVEAVRARMPAEYRDYLGLCPDPTNHLRRFPGRRLSATSKPCPWICSKSCISSRCATAKRYPRWTTATSTAAKCATSSMPRATRALPSWKFRPTLTYSKT